MTVAAVALGFALGITRLEWCAVAIVIGGVWTAEAFNTALELLADAAHPERDPRVGAAKDAAAGAVLVAAVAASVVGLLVFGPRLLALVVPADGAPSLRPGRLDMIAFEKYHGLGNDYLVIEDPEDAGLPAATIERLCHRSLGVGSDGILLRGPNAKARPLPPAHLQSRTAPRRRRAATACASSPATCGTAARWARTPSRCGRPVAT